MRTSFFGGGSGDGGGAVSSVFGRVGAVVAGLNDYAASFIDNDSGVPGDTVKDALETLALSIPAVPVSSVFGRIGAVVAAAGDYNSDQITNVSGVGGTSVSDALNGLATSVASSAPLTRSIGTTAPLSGGGDLSADRTLTVAAVSNVSSGVAPQHAGAADVGKALIATALGAAWGTDFGVRDLVTTGTVSIGTNPATAGNIRIPNGGSVQARHSTTGNLSLLSTNASNELTVGSNAGATYMDSSASGGCNFRPNGFTVLSCTTTVWTWFSPLVAVQFSSGITHPLLRHQAVNGPGGLFTLQGQDSQSIAGTIAGTILLKGGSCTGASGSRIGGNADVQGGTGANGGGSARLLSAAGTVRIQADDTGIGFFAVAPVARQNIVGSRANPEQALADLLTKLALTGLISNGTSA